MAIRRSRSPPRGASTAHRICDRGRLPLRGCMGFGSTPPRPFIDRCSRRRSLTRPRPRVAMPTSGRASCFRWRSQARADAEPACQICRPESQRTRAMRRGDGLFCYVSRAPAILSRAGSEVGRLRDEREGSVALARWGRCRDALQGFQDAVLMGRAQPGARRPCGAPARPRRPTPNCDRRRL
jgi:hypothetical protein